LGRRSGEGLGGAVGVTGSGGLDVCWRFDAVVVAELFGDLKKRRERRVRSTRASETESRTKKQDSPVVRNPRLPDL